jgi:hypothetical protein
VSAKSWCRHLCLPASRLADGLSVLVSLDVVRNQDRRCSVCINRLDPMLLNPFAGTWRRMATSRVRASVTD